MPKIRKEDKLPLRLTQLGKIYRLVEQFEEISRIDLSKLSRLAPATITALTRELIKEKLIVERAVQIQKVVGVLPLDYVFHLFIGNLYVLPWLKTVLN